MYSKASLSQPATSLYYNYWPCRLKGWTCGVWALPATKCLLLAPAKYCSCYVTLTQYQCTNCEVGLRDAGQLIVMQRLGGLLGRLWSLLLFESTDIPQDIGYLRTKYGVTCPAIMGWARFVHMCVIDLNRKVTADHAAYTASHCCQHFVLQGFLTVTIDHLVQSNEWATYWYIANTAA